VGDKEIIELTKIHYCSLGKGTGNVQEEIEASCNTRKKDSAKKH
jgi:hypothetical protein